MDTFIGVARDKSNHVKCPKECQRVHSSANKVVYTNTRAFVGSYAVNARQTMYVPPQPSDYATRADITRIGQLFTERGNRRKWPTDTKDGQRVHLAPNRFPEGVYHNANGATVVRSTAANYATAQPGMLVMRVRALLMARSPLTAKQIRSQMSPEDQQACSKMQLNRLLYNTAGFHNTKIDGKTNWYYVTVGEEVANK